MKNRASFVAVSLVFAVLLGACGGGATTAKKSESPTPAAIGPAVQALDFKFAPAALGVKAGETVTWTNAGENTHNVIASDGSFKSDSFNKGQTFTHTFAAAGSFKYTCTIHPTMIGTITVTA